MKRRRVALLSMLVALACGAVAQEPPLRTRIASVSIHFDRATSLFQVKTFARIDWPEPLEETEAEAFAAHERIAEADEVDATPYSRRFFTVRALDAEGKVLFRTLEVVDLLPGCSGPLLSAEELRTPRPRPEPAVLLSFSAKVPLAGTETIEVRGWRPGVVARWTLEELRADPDVEKYDVFFKN